MDPVSISEMTGDTLQFVPGINMRNLNQVEVAEAIVHIIEPKAGHKALSERCIPLENNPELALYFAEHIRLSSIDPMARSAQFTGEDLNRPSGICPRMFSSSDDFIDGSRYLAGQLYDAMSIDGRVSDGDLVVCRYTVGAARNPEYMAIIKLDPVGAFRNIEVEDSATGKKYVDLRIDSFVFPRTTDILQKGAYLGRSARNSHLEVLLLDKQLRGPEVARFFYEDFLGVSFAPDPAELTLALYKCLIRTLNTLREKSEVTPAEDKLLGNAIYAIFKTQEMFDIYPWIDQQQVRDPAKHRLRINLESALPERRMIPIDLSLVDVYTQRRTFAGQMGLKISAWSDKFGTVVQSVTRRRTPAKHEYYEVVIHTATWNEEI